MFQTLRRVRQAAWCTVIVSVQCLCIAAAEQITFELDIEPILTSRGCNSGACHGKSGGQNGFALSLLGFDPESDFQSIVSAARGRRIAIAAPQTSLLLLKSSAAIPHGGGKKIDSQSDDFQMLSRWIEQGVPRSSPTDRKLDRISISPQAKSLLAGESVELIVTAHYNDSTSRVVTSRCAYQSNEPVIVSVTHDGHLKAGNLPGEATIMARYMGMIGTWSTAIARPGAVDVAAYAVLPRLTPLDDPVWQKLSSMNLIPSAVASESTLLRRAHLDLIGRLPTADEARSFLVDSNPEKFERLVESLLERSEYSDFWANKWADLLRPNPYRVGIKATLSLDSFLRNAFAQNLPYDEFVRQLVTATGSTWRNGAATIFRDRRSPDEIVTMISQLFLGVRLECAKCHQHPFEVYGQKDFYSLAAFFGRVGYKGAGLSPPISGGEETIVVAATGEVRHPLTNEVLAPKPLFGTLSNIPLDQDPRRSLVAWMTSHDNAFFHRAAVNRIWAELFGVGVVDPVDDLRATNPPSNPALLDTLAQELKNNGCDQKKLLSTILRSTVWKLSSIPNATNSSDHRNYSRHYRQRLRAEVLADAIDDVTQVPTSYAGLSPESRAVQLWTHRTGSAFLDVFGRPDPNQDPPCQRDPDATVVQALHLMNSVDIVAKISSDTSRAARLAAGDQSLENILDELYLVCYSRFPTSDERQLLLKEFEQQGRSRRHCIEDILWSLINTPEFVYKD